MLWIIWIVCNTLWSYQCSYSLPAIYEQHFLPFKDRNQQFLQLSHSKDSSWLSYIGQSVTLYTRATRAILNYAPIGEYRQRFFLAECTQYPCGHCQVEIQRHIFANCLRFAHSPLTDPSPLVKDFVDFMKEHPSAFAFSSQERPPAPSEPPWVLNCFAFLIL